MTKLSVRRSYCSLVARDAKALAKRASKGLCITTLILLEGGTRKQALCLEISDAECGPCRTKEVHISMLEIASTTISSSSQASVQISSPTSVEQFETDSNCPEAVAQELSARLSRSAVVIGREKIVQMNHEPDWVTFLGGNANGTYRTHTLWLVSLWNGPYCQARPSPAEEIRATHKSWLPFKIVRVEYSLQMNPALSHHCYK